MTRRCIIIGSGLGALSAGAVLAKNGFDVTIFEQAKQIGGCLQCFWRNGVKFETGMHFVGSLDDGEVLSNYFNFLGIKDKIEVSRMDTSAYNTISLDGERFSIANGHEQMIESLAQRFPNEKDNLRRFWQLVDTRQKSAARLTSFYHKHQRGSRRGDNRPDFAQCAGGRYVALCCATRPHTVFYIRLCVEFLQPKRF